MEGVGGGVGWGVDYLFAVVNIHNGYFMSNAGIVLYLLTYITCMIGRFLFSRIVAENLRLIATLSLIFLAIPSQPGRRGRGGGGGGA